MAAPDPKSAPPVAASDGAPDVARDGAPDVARDAAAPRAGARSPSAPWGSRIVGGLAGVAMLVWIVGAAAWLGLRHVVWPQLDQWRPTIEQRLGEAIGRPVRIGALVPDFGGLAPGVEVRDLRILGPDGEVALDVPSLRAVLSPRTLLTLQWRLARVDVRGLDIDVVRQPDGRWRIGGIVIDPQGPDDGRAIELLLAQRRITLSEARLRYADLSDPDAPQRFALEGVALSLGSVGRRLRASGSADVADPLARQVRVAADLVREPRARASRPEAWSGEAYAQVLGFAFASVQHVTGWPRATEVDALQGEADARVWLRLRGGRPEVVDVRAQARDVAVATGQGVLALRAAQASFALRPLDVESPGHGARSGRPVRVYQIDAERFALVDVAGVALASRGDGHRLRIDSEGRLLAGRVALQPFDAGAVLAMARGMPLPDPIVGWLGRVSADGRVDEARFEWADRSAEGLPADIEARLRFTRLSFDPAGGPRPPAPPAPRAPLMGALAAAGAWTAPIVPVHPGPPSFEGLSGEVSFSEEGGTLRVEGERSALTFPGVFEMPRLTFDALSALVDWSVATDAAGSRAEVRVRRLEFSNPDLAGRIEGKWRSGGKWVGLFDFEGALRRLDATQVVRYLPLSIPEATRAWLRTAVTSGRSNDVGVTLRGDLWDFPFRDPATGQWRLSAKVVDGALAYAPGWPAMDRFQGTITFERGGMDIEMPTARLYGIALRNARARIADFRDSVLVVEGAGEGPAQDMVRFVNETPLATRIADFAGDTRVTGTARIGLRFDMPLSHVEDTTVAGTVQLQDNDVRLDDTLPPFDRVSGRMEFSERGLRLRSVSATFLGGPVAVEGDTPEAGRFLLSARGNVPASGLRQLVDNPLTRQLQGRTDYSARIDLRRRASRVVIESDLAGLESTLPEPFAKPASMRWPLRIETIPEAPGADERPSRERLRAVLDGKSRLELERVREPSSGRMLVRRGAFALDTALELPELGFGVSVSLPDVDVDAWSALLAQPELLEASRRGSAGFAEGFSLLPTRVAIVADAVHVFGKDLRDVVFAATRANGFWRANVAARGIDGHLFWPERPGPGMEKVTARFARLVIPAAAEGEVDALLDSDPAALPALDVVVESFVLGERPLGRLTLQATNTRLDGRAAWRLDALRVENPAATLSASGAWAAARDGAARSTSLRFGLDLHDAGRLLEVLGAPGTLAGGTGRLVGEVTWSGSPLSLHVPSLAGLLRLDTGRGRFLKTEPGLAKLIGVVNLQSLPRRLTLDFRDVFSEGFAFDEIGADVRIERGIARTDNFAMRGVAAQVQITGEADIARETQRLVVTVRPEINAGLASLAYAAAVNPALGLGSFVAQLLLREPLTGIFTYTYDVTGAWDEPVVAERARRREASATVAP